MPTPHCLSLPDADVTLIREAITAADAARLFAEVVAGPWRHDSIRLYGRTHALPRLHQWYSPAGRAYTYSRITMEPAPMLPAIAEALRVIERLTGRTFYGVLANLYRDGADTVGWHRDDETDLGANPVIASLSLGGSRDFALRHPDHGRHVVRLDAGDVLVMAGATQRHWEHAVPRRKCQNDPRVNLTFRSMSNPNGETPP